MQRRSGGARFGVDARRHQGWFRDTSDTVGQEGRSPSDEKGRRNKHLLALGCEEYNLYPGIRGTGGAMEFFRKREISWWKSSRSGDDSKTSGPTRNMASSQVSCVNFLLPLAATPGALTAALRSIDDDVDGIVDIPHDGNTSSVEFEWIGCGGSLEGAGTRGANATSLDAFLVAKAGARRRAYLLEWKYVEDYLSTRPNYKGEGRAGDTRRKRYNDLYLAPYSSFNPAAAPEMGELLYEPFYQIMRQRLLADRMVHDRELDVDEAKVVVVVPDRNLAYRSVAEGNRVTSPPLARRFPQLATVEAVMGACLKDPKSQFDMVAPAALLEAVVPAVPGKVSEWAAYWRERYDV